MAKLTEQQIFDKVATHLLTQMERSVDECGDCRYRGMNGKMCALAREHGLEFREGLYGDSKRKR